LIRNLDWLKVNELIFLTLEIKSEIKGEKNAKKKQQQENIDNGYNIMDKTIYWCLGSRLIDEGKIEQIIDNYGIFYCPNFDKIPKTKRQSPTYTYTPQLNISQQKKPIQITQDESLLCSFGLKF